MSKSNNSRKEQKPDITVRGFVLYESGPVAVEDLTVEQRETWLTHMRDRLSENMSDYYTQHPEAWKRICENLERKEREAMAIP